MTNDQLAAYFHEHVFLAYDRYREVRNDQVIGLSNDRREAIGAATSLFHFREHIPESYRPSRSQLAALCPDYDLLGEIVNAAKHHMLTQGTPLITKAENIYEILVATEFEDQIGSYRHSEKVVEVKLDNGTVRDPYEILTNVVNLWYEELHRMGVLNKNQPIILDRPTLVSRSNACDVRLRFSPGFQWQQRFRLQRYNYQTNSIDVVDLKSAKEIIFTAHKPQTFEVQLQDSDGVVLTREVELTRNQIDELKQIDDPDQKNQHLIKIAIAQGVLGQLVSEYQETQTSQKKLHIFLGWSPERAM